MSALSTGATLWDGRYRLDDVVGRGGMAVVWRATDLQLERDVAIKLISDVLAGDPRFVRRFEREARLAAALNHPNLVKVFDYSIEDERPFLVMEYVPGGTLADARGRPLDLMRLARDLLDAIAHIHRAGILHRDIKPANVLLGADGSPRLTDFGIARGEETSSLTLTGQVLGTLRYIAPEVAAGEPATPQSDLYALGVLLGELEGGHPEPLARLLPRLTAEDPAMRPRSAADALAELDPTRVVPSTEALPATEPLDADRRAPGPIVPPALDASAPTEPVPPTADRRAPGPSVPPTADPPAPSPSVPPAADRPASVKTHPLLAGFRVRPSHAVAGAAILLAILAIVIAAASGGGGSSRNATRSPVTTLRPAAAGAPVNQQLDQLERIVRAAPRRR